MPSRVFDPVAVNVQGLACRRGGRPVFSGMSFRVAPGELLAVTGPNGAGKSSLLRILAGLIGAEAGSLTLDPSDDDTAAKHYLGHADGLKPALTLRETLRFWGAIYCQQGRVPTDADYHEAAEAVGLKHALDLPLGVFSAGQRRRAALARLILSPRPLWLLDEPTASLDAEGVALLGALMARQLKAGGSIVAATHDALPVRPDRTLDLRPAA